MIDFTYWGGVEPSFLDHDAGNPSRAAVGEIVRDRLITHGKQCMVEVGFGGALDYRRQLRELVQAGSVDYTGIDGCDKFVALAQQLYPEAHWLHGTFAYLTPGAFDVVYTMATLEHQPNLETPLSLLLGAVKRGGAAIVNWYRRPVEDQAQEVHEYNETERVHYVTWSDERIEKITEAAGCMIERVGQFAGNTIYVFTR